MAISDPELFKVAQLNLDLRNPRAAGHEFARPAEAVKYLIENADLDEIVTSIRKSGWIDFEPFVVLRDGLVVLEGNRRLASIMLMNDAGLREETSYKLPDVEEPEGPPETVRVLFVDTREEARSFIAFKHINGPAKWGAIAKAKYAAEWVDSGTSIEEVSSALGDTHNTIIRMINGWRVLKQAQELGFDIEDITARRFNFSHLYTAVSKPEFRKHIELEDVQSAGIVGPDPVPEGARDNLLQALNWMYGKSSERIFHLVKSQNPDLTRLVKVLPNTRAMAVLNETKDLAIAFEVILPPSKRFEGLLQDAVTKTERANGAVGAFDPQTQAELIDQVNLLADTVRAMRSEMRNKIAHSEEDDL